MRSHEFLVTDPDAVCELTAQDMKELIASVRSVVEKEETLLHVEGSFYVVGDTHGDFKAVKHIVNLWKREKVDNLVFLGDYVDRGPQQLETINFLLALKLVYPENVFLLRGNHETPSVNSCYGFAAVCAAAFGEKARRMYNEYNILFSYFSPVCLCKRKRILLVHGGIPKGLNSLEELNSLPKGDLNADNDILGQLLWNDPSEYHQGFEPNWTRGIHYTFGKAAFLEFLKRHELSMVIRAHEVFLEGFKYFFDCTLLSIFSSPHYRVGNKAKIAHVTKRGITLITITAN